jgi:hypothetical protein
MELLGVMWLGPDPHLTDSREQRAIDHVSGILNGMGETSDAAARLSPEQRERVRQAIIGELIRAWDAAVSAGVPAEALAGIIDERRRAIEADLDGDPAGSPAVGGDDVQNGGDDPADNGRVGN